MLRHLVLIAAFGAVSAPGLAENAYDRQVAIERAVKAFKENEDRRLQEARDRADRADRYASDAAARRVAQELKAMEPPKQEEEWGFFGWLWRLAILCGVAAIPVLQAVARIEQARRA